MTDDVIFKDKIPKFGGIPKMVDHITFQTKVSDGLLLLVLAYFPFKP